MELAARQVACRMKSDRQGEAAIGRQGRAGDVARLIGAHRNTRRQSNLTMFRGDIRRASGEAEKGVYGADIDDRAAMSACQHGTSLVLHAEKGAFQIDVEHPVPFFLGQVRDSSEQPEVSPMCPE